MRAGGRRLVLTNGCFDLLHAGHLRYLEEARNLGDALAVGINSDASVRRLKGPNRPLNSELDRAEVLAGLQAVDFVVVFAEETAAELVEQIQPAIYVKGGDYSADPTDPAFPVEGAIVLRYGGAVHVAAYRSGHSTTSLLHRMRNAEHTIS
jgi:rfaE bifunctional protein nucleotidyltransferase chain/domain